MSSAVGAAGNRKADNDVDDAGVGMGPVRAALARAALRQVGEHGWTQDAITAAAMGGGDPRLSLSMSGMVSPPDLIRWFMDDMNVRLRQRRTAAAVQASDGPSSASSTDLLFDSIQWRLRQVVPLVERGRWHEGMALGLQTPLVTKAQLDEMVDILLLEVPPSSTSTAQSAETPPHYRAALGGIFVAAELHLLADRSDGHAETWDFLRRRLDELEAHRDDPGRLLLLLHASPLSSLAGAVQAAAAAAVTATSSGVHGIPATAAASAVASSLWDGIASLVLPSSDAGTAPFPLGGSRPDAAGTRASDYEAPPRTKQA